MLLCASDSLDLISFSNFLIQFKFKLLRSFKFKLYFLINDKFVKLLLLGKSNLINNEQWKKKLTGETKEKTTNTEKVKKKYENVANN